MNITKEYLDRLKTYNSFLAQRSRTKLTVEIFLAGLILASFVIHPFNLWFIPFILFGLSILSNFRYNYFYSEYLRKTAGIQGATDNLQFEGFAQIRNILNNELDVIQSKLEWWRKIENIMLFISIITFIFVFLNA